jgi:hypothetical protein
MYCGDPKCSPETKPSHYPHEARLVDADGKKFSAKICGTPSMIIFGNRGFVRWSLWHLSRKIHRSR